MSTETKLAKVLQINRDGVIGPRLDWREAVDKAFFGFHPRMTYTAYAEACRQMGKVPNAIEWSRLFRVNDGEGPGVA